MGNAESHASAGFIVQFTNEPVVQSSLGVELLIDLIQLDRTLLYCLRVSAYNTPEGNTGTAGDGMRIRTPSTVERLTLLVMRPWHSYQT